MVLPGALYSRVIASLTEMKTNLGAMFISVTRLPLTEIQIVVEGCCCLFVFFPFRSLPNLSLSVARSRAQFLPDSSQMCPVTLDGKTEGELTSS